MAFNKIQKYQKHFRKLVELEREEEMKWHLKEIMTYSPFRRQKLGRAIIGLAGKNAGRGLGGSYLVKFGKRNRLPKTDITVGDLVICSTGRPSGDEIQATVTEKTANALTVAYNHRLPSYTYKKDLRIDLFSNDITFQRMLEALSDIGKNQRMQNILLERQRFRQNDIPKVSFFNENLNDSQRKAIRKTLATPDFFLIHGPPGTGKTTTLVESIVQHARQGLHILASADSNVAVDNMLEKMVRFDIKVVRVGNPARVTPALIEHTLDHIITFHPHFQAAQDMWAQVDELKDAQQKYMPASGPNRRGYSDDQIKVMARKGRSARGIPPDKLQSMAQWLRLQQEMNDLVAKAKLYTSKATLKILKEAEVICCTNSTAGSEVINDYLNELRSNFDVAFVDEASQSVEPACLIPIVRADKFIMAGDHKQLPPTVLNQEAQKPLQFTMFERLLDRYGDEVKAMLEVQYRMHKDIMAFPNEQFYDGALKAHPSVAKHTLADLVTDPQKLNIHNLSRTLVGNPYAEVLDPGQPVVFIDTIKLDENIEFQKEGSTSYSNVAEATIAIEIVKLLNLWDIQNEHIGIISPYDDQVDLLRELMDEPEDLEIKTVDGFQGREKEIIVISFVRSNNRGEIGFLKDLRRLNVAITRPKRKLIMIGNRSTLQTNKVYEEMIVNAFYIEAYPI